MPREWVIDEYAGYQGLRLQECEVVSPKSGEVQMRVEAFALNWGDMNLMMDQYSFSFETFPARIGFEAAGIVEAVGDGVTDVEVGGRYCTLPYFYINNGASADTLTTDARYLTRAPDDMTAVEASSIWMQFMTAYYPVIEMARAAPGTNILVPAATSTAGTAALQIGRATGATMIGTTRSAENEPFLRDNGAGHVYVDDGSDLAAFLLDATDGVGVHGVFDPIGADFPSRYGPALAKGAQLMLYGLLTEKMPEIPYAAMWQSNAWLHMYSLFNYVEDLEAQRRGTGYVYAGLADGTLTPLVDKVFPMEGYIDAWRYLEQPRTRHGKVVIETGA
ncbi:MAG: zinc-binding dehydrogenase [Actinomycetota bacterium]